MLKLACFQLLVQELKLKTYAELHAKTPSDKASFKITRGVGTNMRVSFIWWPEGMGAVDSPLGGTAAVRAKVIALMRCELLGGNCVVNDNGVVAHAVARSSYCAGL